MFSIFILYNIKASKKNQTVEKSPFKHNYVLSFLKLNYLLTIKGLYELINVLWITNQLFYSEA